MLPGTLTGWFGADGCSKVLVASPAPDVALAGGICRIDARQVIIGEVSRDDGGRVASSGGKIEDDLGSNGGCSRVEVDSSCSVSSEFGAISAPVGTDKVAVAEGGDYIWC